MTCKKIRYETQNEARVALAICRMSKYTHKRKERRTYECPHCNGWHLTSQKEADLYEKGPGH